MPRGCGPWKKNKWFIRPSRLQKEPTKVQMTFPIIDIYGASSQFHLSPFGFSKESHHIILLPERGPWKNITGSLGQKFKWFFKRVEFGYRGSQWKSPYGNKELHILFIMLGSGQIVCFLFACVSIRSNQSHSFPTNVYRTQIRKYKKRGIVKSGPSLKIIRLTSLSHHLKTKGNVLDWT